MQKGELEGIMVPLVTPFASDESFDSKAMERLIDHMIMQGADALVPTALTGEGLLLNTEETLAVWDTVFEKAAGRLPIVPSVISTTTQKALRLSRLAEERGAAAVLAAPILPELYAGRSQDDVLAFYADMSMAISLPIILFNYPSLTGVDIIPSLAARLAEIENVRYIKESTGDSKRVHGIQRTVGEGLTVICGSPDVALESLVLGCRAWITGIMNVVPRSAKQLMIAVHEKDDLSLAKHIYFKQILPLVDAMIQSNNPTGTIKAGVGLKGIDVGKPRRPGSPLTREGKDDLEKLISAIADAEKDIASRWPGC